MCTQSERKCGVKLSRDRTDEDMRAGGALRASRRVAPAFMSTDRGVRVTRYYEECTRPCTVQDLYSIGLQTSYKYHNLQFRQAGIRNPYPVNRRAPEQPSTFDSTYEAFFIDYYYV